MSDRTNGCTVIFEENIRVDDVEVIMDAIKMIKGVRLVEPAISKNSDYFLAKRVQDEIRTKIIDILYEEYC